MTDQNQQASEHIVPTRDVAIAITVHRIIPEICDLKLETMVPLGSPRAYQDKVLDLMNDLLLRQIAIHTIEDLRLKRDQMVRQVEQAIENMQDNRRVWASQLEDLERQFKEAEADYSNTYKDFAREWEARGKSAPFTPKSHPKAESALGQLTAQQVELENRIKAKREEIEAAEAAHQKNKPVFAKNIEMAEKAVTDAERRIAGATEDA